MIDFSKPIETVNGDPVTYKRSFHNGERVVAMPDGHIRYYFSTGKHVYGTQPDIRNVVEKVDVNLVDQINNAGWTIANLNQDDNQLWSYEIREGYVTSFANVMIGKAFPFMDEALEDAFKKIANFNKLKGLAKDLGITGKVNL
jgi:hypothetical protein